MNFKSDFLSVLASILADVQSLINPRTGIRCGQETANNPKAASEQFAMVAEDLKKRSSW